MLEIDFLPVEAESGPGSKSGDAICMRFADQRDASPIVVVIDGGYAAMGQRLAHHIRTFYGTDRIDLVVSTHPDQDHLNGLTELLESMDVDELMLHLPWEHASDVREYSNIEKIRDLYATALSKGVTVSEPFAGQARFEGRFRVLGPTADYYQELLETDLAGSQAGLAVESMFVALAKNAEAAEEASAEPLDDVDSTSARNSTSVISLVTAGDEYHLFTGDAGKTSLANAADEFERSVATLEASQIEFFHVPHHGSRRNLGPAILDRLFPRGGSTAFISSALADEKHPGEAVLDELQRRGFETHATEGKHLLHHHDGKPRAGYIESRPI
jgi:beta-lactamase superfamily II metal-dependent hydrolase